MLLILIAIAYLPSRGQSQSSLYSHVDSLIRYDLKYDSTTALKVAGSCRVIFKNDKTAGVSTCVRSISTDSSPLIIFAGLIVEKELSTSFTLKEIQAIQVWPPSSTLAALYGARSVNGAILIEVSKNRVIKKLKAMKDNAQ